MASGDVSVSGTRSEETKAGRTTYRLKVKVCNKTDKEIKVMLADNPWRKPPDTEHGNLGPKLIEPDIVNGKPDPKSTRKKALAKFNNPDTGKNEPYTLKPKGKDGDCKEFEFVYDFEPAATYCDVFVMKPDGSPEEDFSDHYTHIWSDVKTASYFPGGPRPQYVCVFPLPYPMSLEETYQGPIKVAITSVEGLPPAFEIVHMFPAQGQAHSLEVGDRRSEGALVLRQTAMIEGRHTVQINYRVVDPPTLATWPPRSISFDIVGGDASAPFRPSAPKYLCPEEDCLSREWWDFWRGWPAMLLASTLLAVPALAALTAYDVIQAVPKWSPIQDVVLFPLVMTLITWLALAWAARALAGAELANRDSHDRLLRRVDSLLANSRTTERARCELTKLRCELVHGRSVGWLLGWAYLDGWRKAHAAEAERTPLLDVSRLTPEVIGTLERLDGSNIPTDVVRSISGRLLVALEVVAYGSIAALENFVRLTGETTEALKTRARPSGSTAFSRESALEQIAEARHVVNRYRDDLWEGLIRQRNRVLLGILVAELAAYVALLFIIAVTPSDGVHPENLRDHLKALLTFFLIGAFFGLFTTIRSDTETGTAVDDYGFATVRRLATPILSGYASIAGIIVSAYFSSVGQVNETAPSIGSLFNLADHPGYIGLAALFGFTPTLLVNKLDQIAEQYKKDLKSSERS